MVAFHQGLVEPHHEIHILSHSFNVSIILGSQVGIEKDQTLRGI